MPAQSCGSLHCGLWVRLGTPRFAFCSPGKILTDDFADKEGLEMGDEYFANLDHIESVENFKEGYESDAKCSSDSSGVDLKDDEEDNTGTEEQEESNEDSSDDNFCKDEGFNTSSVWRSYATRRQTRGQKENGLSETASKDSGLTQQVGHDEAAAAASCKLPVSEETSKNKVASWLSSNSVSDSFQDNDSTSSFKMSEGGEAKGCRADSAPGGADGEAKAPRKDVSGGEVGGLSPVLGGGGCAGPYGGDLQTQWVGGGGVGRAAVVNGPFWSPPKQRRHFHLLRFFLLQEPEDPSKVPG